MKDLIIQRRRHGMTDYVEAFFHPCPHGNRWYWQFLFGTTEINFPNCAECNGTRRGQVAWQSPDRQLTLAAAEQQALVYLRSVFRESVKFSDDIEVYCYHSEAELKLWPKVADDIYICCATYEPATETIRHEPSNVCLIAWNDDLPVFDVDMANSKYREICKEAHDQYEAAHNQRRGRYDARGWLAWLISETIKDCCKGEHPVKRKSVIR